MIKDTFAKLLIVFLIIFLASSSKLTKNHASVNKTNLTVVNISSHGKITPGFYDQKGKPVTEQQMSYFKQLINFASVFYRNDVKARIKYISNQMQRKFSYVVGIITIDSPSNWDFSFVQLYNFWGSVPKGVDKIFPNSSYIFYEQYNQQQQMLSEISKGEGISDQLKTVISNIIQSVQQDQSCNCHHLPFKIRSYINRFTEADDWHVFCSSSLNFHSVTRVNTGRYLVSKEKCYYLVYQN